jgi:hypothetical protein
VVALGGGRLAVVVGAVVPLPERRNLPPPRQ